MFWLSIGCIFVSQLKRKKMSNIHYDRYGWINQQGIPSQYNQMLAKCSNKQIKQTDMKTVTIKAPEGFEFDKVENGEVVFKEKKKVVTYKDVANDLFADKQVFYASNDGNPLQWRTNGSGYLLPNNATTSRQLEKLMAMNKLMNVAKWLNPKGEEANYCIALSESGDIEYSLKAYQYGLKMFCTEDDAMKAVKILGEDVVKLALTNEY